MKAQKRFTVNERLANLEKAVGELYFQLTTVLKTLKEENDKEENK